MMNNVHQLKPVTCKVPSFSLEYKKASNFLCFFFIINMFSSHSAPRGVLTVNLIEARNLHKEDLGGHNDPYVELWLDEDYKQRSEVVKNTENPVWNQTFTFNIDEGSSKHKLYFKVNDKDLIGSDKVGSGHLDVSDVFKGQLVDTWVKLPAKLGLSSHGEVHIIAEFTPQ